MIREMSDDITETEMKIILDQTFATFGLIPGDSITENIFIEVKRVCLRDFYLLFW